VRFLSFVFFLVSVSLSGAGAFGQSNSSFYVSKTGDDSNPGTQTAPWRTIQHAADTVRAGSTVNVRVESTKSASPSRHLATQRMDTLLFEAILARRPSSMQSIWFRMAEAAY
jgi:hypothetical protein